MGPITSGGDLKLNDASVRRTPKRKTPKKTTKRTAKKVTKKKDEELNRPAVGTLTRTKSLLLAALRVWELKQGIRD